VTPPINDPDYALLACFWVAFGLVVWVALRWKGWE